MQEIGDRTTMASAASRAKEKGEGGSHHPVPEHRMDDGGGGGAWPERGRLGDTEVIGHRNHLRKGNFHTKLHLEHLAEKLKLLGLDGDRGEKDKLCSWRKRTFLSNGPRDDGGPTGAPIKESVQEDGVSPVLSPKVLFYLPCPHCKLLLCKTQRIASLPFFLPPQCPPQTPFSSSRSRFAAIWRTSRNKGRSS